MHARSPANSAISRLRNSLNKQRAHWPPCVACNAIVGICSTGTTRGRCEPLPPLFVSTVDSGNLVASLWTLQQGCEQLLEQPVLRPSLADGFLDHLRVLTDLRAFPRRLFARLERRSQEGDWIKMLLRFPVAALERIPGKDPEISMPTM